MLGKCLRAAPLIFIKKNREKERERFHRIHPVSLFSRLRNASEEEEEDVFVVVVARSRRQKEKRCSRINTK